MAHVPSRWNDQVECKVESQPVLLLEILRALERVGLPDLHFVGLQHDQAVQVGSQ